jgi:hypothetical protein
LALVVLEARQYNKVLMDLLQHLIQSLLLGVVVQVDMIRL